MVLQSYLTGVFFYKKIIDINDEVEAMLIADRVFQLISIDLDKRNSLPNFYFRNRYIFNPYHSMGYHLPYYLHPKPNQCVSVLDNKVSLEYQIPKFVLDEVNHDKSNDTLCILDVPFRIETFYNFKNQNDLKKQLIKEFQITNNSNPANLLIFYLGLSQRVIFDINIPENILPDINSQIVQVAKMKSCLYYLKDRTMYRYSLSFLPINCSSCIRKNKIIDGITSFKVDVTDNIVTICLSVKNHNMISEKSFSRNFIAK